MNLVKVTTMSHLIIAHMLFQKMGTLQASMCRALSRRYRPQSLLGLARVLASVGTLNTRSQTPKQHLGLLSRCLMSTAILQLKTQSISEGDAGWFTLKTTGAPHHTTDLILVNTDNDGTISILMTTMGMDRTLIVGEIGSRRKARSTTRAVPHTIVLLGGKSETTMQLITLAQVTTRILNNNHRCSRK